jgi:hypothetical protein
MSESENPEQSRYPLAFDLNGNPIDIPEGAVAWRVRRGGGRRGRPRNVFDPETGRQLEVPLGASIDDLIEAGCPADRYLLYPVDAEGHTLPGVVAVTEIQLGAGDEDGEAPERADRGDIVAQLLATVRAQSDTLCRALEAAASGYGQVRPAPPAPIVVEQQPPAPEPGSIQPDQIAQIVGVAKSVFDSFKAGGGTPPTEGGGT